MWPTRWQSSVNIAVLVSLSDNFALDAGTHLALNRITDREFFVGFTVRR